MTQPERTISSRDNPLLQRVRKLLQDPVAYRKLGQFWLEGEHLALALRARGGHAQQALVAESAGAGSVARVVAGMVQELVLVPDRLFAEVSSLPSTAGVGLLCELQKPAELLTDVASVVLDRLQDPGNIGSVLRSSAAMGVTQVIALKGTAGLWSPKVLRAGMGAHFGLHILESQPEEALARLSVPLLATSSHAGQSLTRTRLPAPAAWVLGHEGQGIASSLLQRCGLTLRIPQPGGEESLNVAASAAICLYESMRQRLADSQTPKPM